MIADKATRQMRKRIINSFLDILFLAELRKDDLTGYGLGEAVKRSLQVSPSSAVIYQRLDHLETDKKFITRKCDSAWGKRVRLCSLTDEGKAWIDSLVSNPDVMTRQLLKLLGVS